MQKRCRDVRVVLVVENLAPLFDTFPEQGRQKDALHGEGPAMVAEVLQEPDDLPEVTAGDAVLVLQPLVNRVGFVSSNSSVVRLTITSRPSAWTTYGTMSM